MRLDGAFVRLRRCAVTIFVLVLVSACVVVRRTFVLVRTAMLSRRNMISKIVVQWRAKTATHIVVSHHKLAHVARGILVELLVLAEDEDGDIH